LGYSAGSAFQLIRQMKHELDENSVVVVLFHDHGSRYVGKIFNDDWMRERGFLNEEHRVARDLYAAHKNLPLLSVNSGEPVHNAIALMRKYGVSQLPVMEHGKFVGSLDDIHLLPVLTKDPSARDKAVVNYMNAPFPVVQASDPLSTVAKHINEKNGAVLVELGQGKYHIITRHDLVAALS
jgi:cystathionine beta-synthase